MTSGRRITLGAFVTSSGVHATSWRLPEVVVTSPPSFETYKRVVRKLEAGCVDTVFMNDSIGTRMSSRAKSRATRAPCDGIR